MCNFYLMYFVKNDDPLKVKYCISDGPPFYHWENPDNGFKNIPKMESSTL